MNSTATRTTRFARSTTRVRPHLLRRDGIVEQPREYQTRSRYEVAVSIGWRPHG